LPERPLPTPAVHEGAPASAGARSRASSRSGRTVRLPSDDAPRAFGFRHPALLLGAIWLLGTVALGAIVQFQSRVDETRQAQVVIAQMRNQQGALLAIAFDPAVAATVSTPGPAQTTERLTAAKKSLNGSVISLERLGNSDAPARIGALNQDYFRFIDRLSELVATGGSHQAALELGESQQPGGLETRLALEFQRADARYGADASRSKTVASIGTLLAIVSLLLAFSVVYIHAARGRQRNKRDAMTDALTGLGNRRKLFTDMAGVGSHDQGGSVSVGIFDLDGFKAYNDTFGHPAGDALLGRIATRLASTVAGRGEAYRIGGDEFAVIAGTGHGEELLADAQRALTDDGPGFFIGCSRGTTQIVAGGTLEGALHEADQRLYANKRVRRSDAGTEARDTLLQVLVEQDAALVDHLRHVAELAASTATDLGLSDRQVELTRLAAELHDVGKLAIPATILDKPGQLTPAEFAFIQGHSLIGERIVLAAPALKAIAPIVRATHERVDGTGYPDGLVLDEIPICARVIAVVDAFDAMTSDRPYRAAMPDAVALDELHRHAGTQFDPSVVAAFDRALARRNAGFAPVLAQTG
jgi:diguanylate cyclase (GGDEF)-like protein